MEFVRIKIEGLNMVITSETHTEHTCDLGVAED